MGAGDWKKTEVVIFKNNNLFLIVGLFALMLGSACSSPARTEDKQPAASDSVSKPTSSPTPSVPTPTATAAEIASDGEPTATSASIAPDPEPTATMATIDPVPVPSTAPIGDLLANGRMQDAQGFPSFAGWEQDPAYWCNWLTNPTNCGLHRPLPHSPSQTWYLQADRDFQTLSPWPDGCCPEARAWTDVTGVPPHSFLAFGWEEIHHLREGNFELRVYGIDENGDLVEIFFQDGPRSPVISTKQDPPGVYLEGIPIPVGGYSGYRVEVYARLAADSDGILVGDFKLLIYP
jgi:hypothetical protein